MDSFKFNYARIDNVHYLATDEIKYDNYFLALAIYNSLLSFGNYMALEKYSLLKLAHASIDSLNEFYSGTIKYLLKNYKNKPNRIIYKDLRNVSEPINFHYIALLYEDLDLSKDYKNIIDEIGEYEFDSSCETYVYYDYEIERMLKNKFNNYFCKKCLYLNNNLESYNHIYDSESFILIYYFTNMKRPTKIPNLANVYTYGEIFKYYDYKFTALDLEFAKKPIDLLTFYIGISDSRRLKNMKFTSLPRSSRRSFIEKLNEILTSNMDIDLFLKEKKNWIKAFKMLHISEFKEFPNALEIASRLRNNNYVSKKKKLELAFDDENNFINLLKDNHNYLKHINLFLKNNNRIIDNSNFIKMIDDVLPKDLVKIYNFFKTILTTRTRIYKQITLNKISYYEKNNSDININFDDIYRLLNLITSSLDKRNIKYIEHKFDINSYDDFNIEIIPRNIKYTLEQILYDKNLHDVSTHNDFLYSIESLKDITNLNITKAKRISQKAKYLAVQIIIDTDSNILNGSISISNTTYPFNLTNLKDRPKYLLLLFDLENKKFIYLGSEECYDDLVLQTYMNTDLIFKKNLLKKLSEPIELI